MTKPVALITGGASGIGKATAIKLASCGINVVISGRGHHSGDAAAKEIEAAAIDGARVRFIKTDVTDEAAMQALVDEVVAEFGCLDMAVNNAGIYTEAATIDQSDTEKFRAMIETNVLGVYYGMKYEIGQM